MTNEAFMTKENLAYFTSYFNDNQKNGTISFDSFCTLLRDYKGISDKAVLEESLKELRSANEKKNSSQGITLRQEEYFNFLNTVLKDQAQSKNQNDPEMEKLFKSLSDKEGEYVYKKKLSDIITMFGLPVNLNEFFQPVGGQEQLNFNEFCCLFQAEKKDENLRKTFTNFIDKSSKEQEEKENIKAIYRANFPIKYYGD